MLDGIVQAVRLGLTSAGLALLVRAAPWPAAWKKRKPLSCAVCMSLWTMLLMIVPLVDITAGPAGFQALGGLLCVGIAVSALIQTIVLPPPVDLGD